MLPQRTFSPQPVGLNVSVNPGLLSPLNGNRQPAQVSRGSSYQPSPVDARQGLHDLVQFGASTFYCHERDGSVTLHVMRLGHLRGTCSVRYYTRDGSARAGDKYKATDGILEFQPGEHLKTFDVEILSSDMFDTTLLFTVVLEAKTNCTTPPIMFHAKVSVSDDDLFPNNRFEDILEQAKEVGSDVPLHNVGVSLIWYFIRFTYEHVPGIRWKSIVFGTLAQLENGYYLMTIYLRVYLVDTCLNMSDEDSGDRLLIPDNRKLTAFVLGAAWILPNFLLLGADFYSMRGLEMGFYIRKYLRVNLFRKYLNYTKESRDEVPVQDINASIMDDIPEMVANGYLIVFSLLKMNGKILMVAFFLLSKHPRAALPMLAYMFAIVVYLSCRYSKRLDLLMKVGDGESETEGWIIHVDTAQKVIKDYDQRNMVVARFEQALESQHSLSMQLKGFQFWNSQLVPWLTVFLVGGYIAIGSKLVIDGEISLGYFLSTINVYKDLGERFDGIYNGFIALSEVVDPLAAVTRQFNMDTDISDKHDLNHKRLAYAEDKASSMKSADGTPVWDCIPLVFNHVKVEHAPTLCGDCGLNVTIPQGTIVHIKGPHDSGKFTLLQLITDNVVPADGEVLFSPHLRVLYVSYRPVLVDDMNLYGNISFGHDHDEPHDFERVRRILLRLGLGGSEKPWIMKQFEHDISAVPKAKKLVSPAPGSMGKKPQRRSRWSCCSGQARAGTLKREGSNDNLLSSNSDNDSAYDTDKDESMDEEDLGEASEWVKDDDDSWQHRLSNSELKRLQMVRAFVYNPEVMVLHRPVDEHDDNLSKTIQQMLREFVENRGLELDPVKIHERRPRTVVYTGGMNKESTVADIVWSVGPDTPGITVQHHRRRLNGISLT